MESCAKTLGQVPASRSFFKSFFSSILSLLYYCRSSIHTISIVIHPVSDSCGDSEMVFQSGCAWYCSDMWENRRFRAKSLVSLLVLVPVMYVNLHQLATSKIEVGCLFWTSSASSCGYREYNLVRINICATWSLVERASTILFNIFSRSLVTF